MEMHYRLNEFQNFLQNLALGAHDGLYQKRALAFIRHCSRVGGNDKLAIEKGGNLPEKVENHCSIGGGLILIYKKSFLHFKDS